MVAAVPLKRMAEPAEMAHAAIFIAENDYFSGRVIEVDGAQNAYLGGDVHPDIDSGGSMRLNEIRAVITGGASGLGNAVATKLVAAGAQVTLIDVKLPAGEAAAKTLGHAARFKPST